MRLPRRATSSPAEPAAQPAREWDARAELGRRGEDLAARFLEARGFRIVERNWRPASGAQGERIRLRGELDAVAWEGPVLCFVEVKSRSSAEWGTPGQAVNAAKQRQIVRLAQAFLALRAADEPAIWDAPCRFDVVEVWLGESEAPRIALHRAAFDATEEPRTRRY